MGRKLTAERQEQRSAAIRLRQAGWSQPEIGRALAVPRETIRDWLKIATDVAGVDRRLYYIANSTKLRIGDNHHQPITLFPCRYEEVGEGIAPESIDLILTDPPYLASAQDITRPRQKTDLRRNYGKWDKTSKREYTHNVTFEIAEAPPIYNVWNYSGCDPRFGQKHPGQIPGQSVSKHRSRLVFLIYKVHGLTIPVPVYYIIGYIPLGKCYFIFPILDSNRCYI